MGAADVDTRQKVDGEPLRVVPAWHARADTWRAMRPRTWGPVVADARRLWSREVLELVAGHVGARVPDVAERLLAMGVQQRYLVLGTIARPPQCTILGAVDQLLARSVALKVLERDDEATWKLVAEVQAMARLDHAHVVRVFDMGDHEGSIYAALELCEGNLDDWCIGRPWTDVLARVIETGRGLAAVHAAGLVHGDVKPENVFLKGGAAKLGDFGLASRPGLVTQICGTVGYIAPEVGDGRQGFAGDVFAFGCTAWVCLTGEHPFGDPPATADSSSAIMVLIERAREGQVRETDADVPARVLAVLQTALRPDPRQRPTLDVLLDRLAALHADATTRVRWRWWKRLTSPQARSTHGTALS